MEFYFRKVGRNLNRVYRTLEFFGIKNMYLVECNTKIKGNLFKATGAVDLISLPNIPDDLETVYLETDGIIALESFDFSKIKNIVIGGESESLPKSKLAYRVKINGVGKVSGLTVEAALSIVLYELYKQNVI